MSAIYRIELTDWRPRASLYGPNARFHWAVGSERRRHISTMLRCRMLEAGWPTHLPDNGRGWTVVFRVRQRLGALPDDDNRHGMLKACRDCVARQLGVTDDPSGPHWEIEWQRGDDGTTVELRDERNAGEAREHR